MSKEFICKGCGEKFNKDMQSNNVGYCYICNEFYMRKQVADLEAKLAESEKNYAELFCRNTELETLYSQKTALLNFYKDTDLVKENTKLKQQLAEKEKELHYKTAECEKWKADYENCSKLEKLMSKERQYCLDNWRASNQDKISFALEQLEKVKEELEFTSNNNEWITARDDRILNGICDFIDNQIKQLKEMK